MSAPTPVPAGAAPAAPEPHLLAVIAAAVAATLQQPCRIIEIQPVGGFSNPWVIEGRFEHFSSHKVR